MPGSALQQHLARVKLANRQKAPPRGSRSHGRALTYMMASLAFEPHTYARDAPRKAASEWNATRKTKPTLTTLPVEIRNIIYTYALCKEKKISIFRNTKAKDKTARRHLHGNASLIFPNLLRNCKLATVKLVRFSTALTTLSYLHIYRGIPLPHQIITLELNDHMSYRDGRDDVWNPDILCLARDLAGLQDLKIRLYVQADFLDVADMILKLAPIMINMQKARTKEARAWTQETMAQALSFSVKLKRSRSWAKLRPLGGAEQERLGQDFKSAVWAGLAKEIMPMETD